MNNTGYLTDVSIQLWHSVVVIFYTHGPVVT